jgi:hypothetical protein
VTALAILAVYDVVTIALTRDEPDRPAHRELLRVARSSAVPAF